MKNLIKTAFLASLLLVPSSQVQADTTQTYQSSITFNESESIKVNGKTYYDSGYVAEQRGLVNDYDGLINDKYFGGRPDVKYKKGQDNNTILVEIDNFIHIFVTKDFPKDKIPAEVYNASYKVKNIDKSKNEIELAYISGGGEIGNMFRKSKFLADLSEFDQSNIRTGDQIKAWHWFPTNGYEELLIPKVYKYQISSKTPSKDMSPREILANKIFDNLVESEAAAILVDNIWSLDIAIRESLKDSIKESDKIIKKGYKALLTKEESSSDDSKAIIKIIQIKYGKKLETDKDKKLALSIYDNMIMANAGRKLLNDYPNVSRPIEKNLRVSVDESEQLVSKALENLK